LFGLTKTEINVSEQVPNYEGTTKGKNMKIIFALVILFVLTFYFLQGIELSLENNILTISGSFELEKFPAQKINGIEYLKFDTSDFGKTGNNGEAELPVFSKLVNLPNTGNYVLKDLEYDFEELDLDKKIIPFGWEDNTPINSEFYYKDEWFPKEIIKISKPSIMRGVRFSQISLAAAQYNPALNKIRILKNIKVDLELYPSKNENSVANDRNSNIKPFSNILIEKSGRTETPSYYNGNYLLIAPDNCVSYLQPLLRHKEKLGYKTRLATLTETGSSNTSIKNFIQNAYDNWDYPPENVILIGDVDGTIVLPSYFVEGYWTPWDVTDHPYTLLEGDDYFPDIMLGRIPVRSLTQLATVVNKIIKYESEPYPGDWIKHALMCGVVKASWHYYSARETKMAVRDKLLNFGYTFVDTLISPYEVGQTQLENKINEGYSFVNYRGFGDWNYWWGEPNPMFNLDNINNLTNGYKLPMITSIVCGGGNFACDDYPSAFGETWLLAGSPAIPKGAIGFIGPSELNTKTPFNNANDMGIYQGITQENLFTCGEMLLRGKMELYNNFPDCHEWGDATNSDQFYFYVYGLLGDPGLSIWTDTPKEVSMNFTEEMITGENYLNVGITTSELDKSGFTIAVTNSDSLITIDFTDANGEVNIPLSLEEGVYEITASKYGYIPETDTLSVIDGNIVGLYEYTFMDSIVSGEIVDLEVIIKNLGEFTATNIYAVLTSNDDYLQIILGNINIESLGAGDSEICEFQFQIGEEWYNGQVSELFLNVDYEFESRKILIRDEQETFLIPVEINAAELVLADFIVANPDSCLIQNNTEEVYLELQNCGNYETGDFYANLISLNDKTEVLISNRNYSNISVGTSGTNANYFQVSVEDVLDGEQALFRLEISDNRTILQELEFSIPIGFINEFSPTFCEYGYYAIESNDSGNFTPPVYNWIEIENTGTQITGGHATEDGFIKTIDLPFDFQYFGTSYDKISVCSNGYLCMGETDLMFHRNRTIPSGSGSPAMIAPFWDDLKNGNLYYFYDTANDYFIIEWTDFQNVYNPYYDETFEVILYDPEFYPTPTGDGEILFQYNEINNIDQGDNYATVGIENEAQTQGLLMTFANNYAPTAQPIEDETAIFFTITESPYYPTAPQNITISVENDSIYLEWDAVDYATSYDIYSADDPYSNFVIEAEEITTTNWNESLTDIKKFYYIKAVN